jgi:trehalose-6-phosphate synthase
MNVWCKERLHELVQDRLSHRFIAVSNREPYIHRHTEGGIECIQPASGLATAIDPIMRASGGTWIAHGSGTADRHVVDMHDRIAVPPGNPAYTLRRVWLPEALERGYYYGLANEGLWPLCHIAFQRPRFSEANWNSYRAVNELFAEAVLDEVGSDPAFVFIQDFHFALLPRLLKRRNPKLIIAQFWHIPWPNRETFRAFPWKEELLDGMLGNDLLGFHLSYHCSNFLETVDREVEALVDSERSRVTRGGHVKSIRPFPISIDFDRHTDAADSPAVQNHKNMWRSLLGGTPEILGIGIDRIDYTKGILERLNAVDTLLSQRADLRGKLVFVQVGVPSRTGIADYDRLDAEVTKRVDQINSAWSAGNWRPILFVHKHVDQQALMALHQMADFCIVSSLHDGMNLVAKEFVASRTDDDGVLILSRFTGSARELTSALLVNPFAPDEMVCAMETALVMPRSERRRRMQQMRSAVRGHNIYRWAGKVLQAVDRVVAGCELEETLMFPRDRMEVGAA